MKKIKLPVLYANQFVPLWSKEGLFQRLHSYGKYDSLLSGGGICHAQINTETTAKQNETIVREAVKSNCQHFALNRVYSRCPDCGHVCNHKTETCPNCNGQNMEFLSRIIGYFVPIKSWNATRRFEFTKRHFVDDSLTN